jgi:hypothetical protein
LIFMATCAVFGSRPTAQKETEASSSLLIAIYTPIPILTCPRHNSAGLCPFGKSPLMPLRFEDRSIFRDGSDIDADWRKQQDRYTCAKPRIARSH